MTMASVSEPEDMPVAVPELICYPIEADPPKLVPARTEREWMNLTDQRYAYRCIPLSIANASGWELVLPCSFSASWTGGDQKSDIQIRPLGEHHHGQLPGGAHQLAGERQPRRAVQHQPLGRHPRLGHLAHRERRVVGQHGADAHENAVRTGAQPVYLALGLRPAQPALRAVTGRERPLRRERELERDEGPVGVQGRKQKRRVEFARGKVAAVATLPGIVQAALLLALTVGIAIVLHLAVEKPMRVYINRRIGGKMPLAKTLANT